ncbi:MAG: DNA polymerase III subunit delta, partial [Nitrospirae bacterium]|nr:DNA polymerase III subunit delta [Nitrospirota bacterium]
PGLMSYQDFTAQVDRGTLAPVYLLTGEEEFLIQSATERLSRAVVDPATRDFNTTVIDGETATADAILTAVESLPAFAERRLVIFRNADQLPAGEANRLVPYLKNPSPTTCFACVASKFDARRSFFQALKAQAVVVDCRPLTDAQVTVWLKAQAQSMGRAISEDALLFLKERVGRDLFPLQNELTKAVIGSDHEKWIEMEDVQRACSASGAVSVYDLLTALARRQTEPSIRTLTRLVEEGEPPLKILSTIGYRFRLVWKVKRAMQAGHTDAALMRMFGLGQWAGASVIAAAKAYSEKDLRWAFQRFVETDAGLKGGALAPKLILELLVLDLCSGKQKGLRRFLGRQPLLYL